MPYRLDINDPPGDALDRLIQLGALDVDGDARHLAAILPDAVAADAVRQQFSGTGACVSTARARDDGSVWVLAPRAVRIGRVSLVPAREPAPAGSVRLLDSEAFGTGLHPTTALCLQLLDDEIGDTPPARALDVGTGSGVLALAALHLGVPHVTAIDKDLGAILAASENARLNVVAPARLALVATGPAGLAGMWPLIAANILAAPLMEMAPELVPRVARRGRLILSGIPVSMAEAVTRVYQHAGMRPVRREARDGWAALLLQGYG